MKTVMLWHDKQLSMFAVVQYVNSSCYSANKNFSWSITSKQYVVYFRDQKAHLKVFNLLKNGQGAL